MPTEKLKDNPVLENETDDVLKEIKDLEDELDIEIVEDEEEPPKAPDAPEDDDEDEDEGDEDEEEGDEDEDEDEDEDVDEDEDDDEEDLKQYSKNVQKRIRREVKLRKQAEQAISRATQQRNMIGSVAQKEHQEKTALQEKYDNLEDQYVNLLENSITGTLEAKQQQLIQARDEGDTAAEIRLQSELEDMRLHKRQLTEYKETMEVTREQRKQEQPAQQGQQQQPNPKAVEYLKKNIPWMKKRENAPAVAYLQTLDNQVLQEGFDPDSDQYYKEVDRRLKAAFPNLGKKKTRKRRNSNKKGSAAPAAPVAAEGASKPRSDGKVRLTKTDLDNMRAFGMDPENKDHLKAYAQQKVN